MATIEHSAVIKASRERVFALLERVENFVDYSDMIESIEPLGDRRYRWNILALKKHWSFVVQVTELRPPEVMAWESVEGVSNKGRYDLTEVAEGTRVKLSVEYEIRNKLLEKAVNKAAQPIVNRVSQQIIERIEARL